MVLGCCRSRNGLWKVPHGPGENEFHSNTRATDDAVSSNLRSGQDPKVPVVKVGDVRSTQQSLDVNGNTDRPAVLKSDENFAQENPRVFNRQPSSPNPLLPLASTLSFRTHSGARIAGQIAEDLVFSDQKPSEMTDLDISRRKKGSGWRTARSEEEKQCGSDLVPLKEETMPSTKPRLDQEIGLDYMQRKINDALNPSPQFYSCINFVQIEDICSPLILSDETIAEVREGILTAIKEGLGKSSNSTASVKCFPTFVRDLPNGTVTTCSGIIFISETGKFLALDLGGTNFRVLLIELGPQRFSMESKIFAVPKSVMLGSGEGLFDHIADCLGTFMKEHGVEDEKLPLGFTFSFPCSQEGLTRARLVTWTKGFNCAGVEGEDVVRLLREAVARKEHVNIDVLAVLNDTTGCLMSCAWKERNTYIGVIIGTGTNACYMERLENVETWNSDEPGAPQVIINTEWGAFGENSELDFIRTKWDNEIDSNSLNPGKHIYEKMISGMYMGELARLVLVDLAEQGLIFQGLNCEELMEKDRFYTKYISEIEGDKKGDYHNARLVLEELGLDDATNEDCENMRYVCECVSRRAAFLVSAGIATLLNRMGRPSTMVAVDGSVYRFHPHVHNLMMMKIGELVNPGIKFDLMLSEDGSGRGAALVAAVACRLAREHEQGKQQAEAS
ncbi:unnamed protein product [Cyprideis torosa]|uniref:hexokinase n=1 Tax=Cyprideis torosa TaxID=163714 RepID=A0A7R8W832_9CRUS|nr:unnamed protein product [Cyprideis torosa]CAG0885823.1 unnamed protein product [Cyprideis torosa]